MVGLKIVGGVLWLNRRPIKLSTRRNHSATKGNIAINYCRIFIIPGDQNAEFASRRVTFS